jgi:hypothetical protein
MHSLPVSGLGHAVREEAVHVGTSAVLSTSHSFIIVCQGNHAYACASSLRKRLALDKLCVPA